MCAHTCVSTCVHRMACMHAHTCACILCVCVCASNHLVCDVHTGWTACPSQRCAGGGRGGAGRGSRSEHWPRSPSASSVRLAPPRLARRPLYALHLPPRIPRRTWAAFHRFVKWPPFPSQMLEGAETGQPRKSLSGAASARGRLSGSPVRPGTLAPARGLARCQAGAQACPRGARRAVGPLLAFGCSSWCSALVADGVWGGTGPERRGRASLDAGRAWDRSGASISSTGGEHAFPCFLNFHGDWG